MDSNIGWLYNKDYYHELAGLIHSKSSETAIEKTFKKKNKQLLKVVTKASAIGLQEILGAKCQYFKLKVSDFGFVTGVGYSHETGHQGEVKLGLYFDHTSGMPILEGSSVKGALNAAFNFPKFIIELSHNIGLQINENQVKDLQCEIFDGIRQEQTISMPQRDCFYAAYISNSEPTQLFESEFITPHKEPLKNPVPLELLKIRGGNTFQFEFQLHDSVVVPIVNKTHKLNIFKQIILTLGMGAKTNVGFGHFIEL